MERLTPLATAFLDAEDVDPRASLAIGSLAVFAGPAPSYDEFVDLIAGRLPLIPRYRQRLRTVPFDLAAPAWVDDPDFDIRWHVRNTALPSPGGRDEIGRLVSARDVAPDGPRPTAVGVLVLRGAGRRAVGPAVQAPPQHGRRGLRHRPVPTGPGPHLRRPARRCPTTGRRRPALDGVGDRRCAARAGDRAAAGRPRRGRLAHRPPPAGEQLGRDGAGAADHVDGAATGAAHVAHRAARGQSPLHVDGRVAGRHPRRAGGVRRDGQRRRTGRGVGGLPAAAAVARRGARRAHPALAGAGVDPRAGCRVGPGQPGLADAALPAGGRRRPCRAPARRPGADPRPAGAARAGGR